MWNAIILTRKETLTLRAHAEAPTKEGEELARSLLAHIVAVRRELSETPAVVGIDPSGHMFTIDRDDLRRVLIHSGLEMSS